MKVDIACFTGNSGLTDYSVSLARTLMRFCDVTLVTSNQIDDVFTKYGFPILKPFRRSRHYFLDIFKFMALLISRRPDWVIFQGPLKFPFVDALVVYVLRLFGIRCLITVHDVLPHYPKWWSKYEYGFYYRAFNRIIVHSEVALAGCRQLGITADALVVPHGIYDIFNVSDLQRDAAIRMIDGLSETNFSVLFFGHLEPRKGLSAFLQAAERLREEDNLKFVLAGSNSLASHGQHYVEQLASARQHANVIVHDRRIPFEEVERYFAACDVIALPYLEGTTSGVLKLALAFSKPVIITRVGDLPAEMPEGAGIIIENDDNLVTSLCSAIKQIQSDYSHYLSSMQQAAGNAQWSDIAEKIHNFMAK
jgi:Glycosyltransferase